MSGITNPAEEYFKDGLWGYDGTVWRKLNLLFGYNDRWAEADDSTAVGEGDAIASTVAVPSGYVYILQAAATRLAASGDHVLELYVYTGSVATRLNYQTTLVTGKWYCWEGRLVLKAGDVVKARGVAPGDGVNVYLSVWGYKMKVT